MGLVKKDMLIELHFNLTWLAPEQVQQPQVDSTVSHGTPWQTYSP